MKLNLIYYKNVLDMALEKMLAPLQHMFLRDDDGRYVLGAGWSKAKLEKLFDASLREALLEVVVPSSKTHDKFILIGSCWPKDNLLLKFKDSSYFPKKLERLVEQSPSMKYLLREKDICIDISFMNEMFIDAFNKMLVDGDASKLLGKSFSNVVAVSHSHLDCYAMFKVIKWAYGNSNCINVWKQKMAEKMQHLVAVNELIAKYVQKKACMNRSKELKMCAKEAKCYLDEKLGIV